MSEEKVVQLLRELVAIPSVNPFFSDAPANSTGEERLADHLMQWAKQRSISAEYIEAAPHRPCVLLESGPDNAPSIMISAHMDTVWTVNMDKPFELQSDGKYLYGLGAVDDKGPLAAALTALENLNQQNLKVKFQVLASCDEEYGLCGIKKVIPELLSPSLHITSEPTSLKIVTAEKGSCRFKVTVRGKTAHSSVPHLGDNAITKAMRLIEALEKYSAYLNQQPPHPLLDRETLTVTTINGGTQTSSVADKCEFSINYRTLPGRTPENLQADLENTMKQTGIDFELWSSFDAPPVETAKDDPWIRKMCHVLQKNSLDANPFGVPYASEAFQAAKYDIPVFIFGPGDINTAHAPNERICIDELITASKILEDLIRDEN